ncbi:MAG: MBL fold metallo-hydrolase [Pseudobdellovibrionaceae bacterium]
MEHSNSDHFNGKVFFNPWTRKKQTLGDVYKMLTTRKLNEWPKWVENKKFPSLSTVADSGEVVLTFVNHVTFLIQASGLNILTDPHWGMRTSPVSWAGPKRHRDPGVKFSDLPEIDLVLISHNHYDHMDHETILKLEETFSPVFVTSLGNKTLLEKWGCKKVFEMDWWDQKQFPDKGDGTIIHFVPSQHFSARGPFDRNRTLWGGFVIGTQDKKIYFAGDTGYGPQFKMIRERLGKMDISLLPIGAYEPQWFMSLVHVNPEEAVQAHIDLESELSIGMHHGTFQLTEEAIDAPIIDLDKARKKLSVDQAKFFVLDEGDCFKARF